MTIKKQGYKRSNHMQELKEQTKQVDEAKEVAAQEVVKDSKAEEVDKEAGAG